MPRFVILEHTAAPDDPAGRHFDLLLEQGPACRTWRLAAIPEPGGPSIPAVETSLHRLAWLDHHAGPVSVGRGFARRIDAGVYETAGPTDDRDEISVTLHGDRCTGRLHLVRAGDLWHCQLLAPDPCG